MFRGVDETDKPQRYSKITLSSNSWAFFVNSAGRGA
jgi:hypothetical protein